MSSFPSRIAAKNEPNATLGPVVAGRDISQLSLSELKSMSDPSVSQYASWGAVHFVGHHGYNAVEISGVQGCAKTPHNGRIADKEHEKREGKHTREHCCLSNLLCRADPGLAYAQE